MRATLVAMALLCLTVSGFAAEEQTPAAEPSIGSTAAKQTDPTPTPTSTPAKTTTKTAAKSSAKTPAKKLTSSKPKNFKRTEAELSGITSETSDQFASQLNLSETHGLKKWFIKTGYRTTKTRSYSTNKVYETKVNSRILDSQMRIDGRRTYKFLSATANIQTRSPHTKHQRGKSGYRMISAGFGKKIAKNIECEVALAGMATYDDRTGQGPALVSSLRWKKDLSSDMILDGHAYLARPFGDNALVDARTDLTYKLTTGISLRFTYVLNNLLRPINAKQEWDRSLRVSLVFSSLNN